MRGQPGTDPAAPPVPTPSSVPPFPTKSPPPQDPSGFHLATGGGSPSPPTTLPGVPPRRGVRSPPSRCSEPLPVVLSPALGELGVPGGGAP